MVILSFVLHLLWERTKSHRSLSLTSVSAEAWVRLCVTTLSGFFVLLWGLTQFSSVWNRCWKMPHSYIVVVNQPPLVFSFLCISLLNKCLWKKLTLISHCELLARLVIIHYLPNMPQAFHLNPVTFAQGKTKWTYWGKLAKVCITGYVILLCVLKEREQPVLEGITS